ncbi:N,N'-diacetylchitobiose transport system permease protein [Conyzicola lurida]|uniref:N,N'-diacetylchitobiose transport system permease protein n=1 Tax=Conyzicola lurida TaxID=1172621 RepID=A0A841AJP5_9MICO|nr:sugar ABC transporter permease [Conyzicola lurida]MBB5841931.1 N,N'-diacetylchitobiose transport system permease protein [Conyzicola lurida]
MALTVERRRTNRAPYLLLIPAVGILLIGMGYPVVWQAITSLQEYGLQQQFGKAAPFVFLENYIELATNASFWAVVAKSIAFCLITAVATLAIGLGLALLMNVVGKAPRLILQIALLLAWSMPVVAAMTVWIWLFDRRRGAVNYLLDLIPGVDMNRFNWLETPTTFFIVASVIVIWMSVPFVAFSSYAGLTQISEEVMEAAQLDGANGWQRFWGIILPMIRPVIAIVFLLQIIWDLRVFTQITMLQDAGSKSSEFDLLGTYIFKLGTKAQDFGMASAVSILVLAITIVLSWFYIRSLLKEDEA